MSGKMVGLVFDHYPGAGGGELLLAVKLADNASDDGTEIYPSVTTLAELTRQSERTVQVQLKRMRDMGWLEVVREARGPGRGGDRGFPRIYRIAPLWLASLNIRIPEDQRPVWVRKDLGQEKEMGADSAPSDSNKWVQPQVEMGAAATAEMGAVATAPKPSLTVTEQNTPLPPKGGARGFDALWIRYPKRLSEAKARAAWAKLNPDTALQKRMLEAVDAQITSPLHRWSEMRGQYIPRLHKWITEERWTDDVAVSHVGSEAEWWTSQDGIKSKGGLLGLPFSLAALGNSYTDDQKLAHWRAYRDAVFAAAGEGKWTNYTPSVSATPQQRQRGLIQAMQAHAAGRR